MIAKLQARLQAYENWIQTVDIENTHSSRQDNTEPDEPAETTITSQQKCSRNENGADRQKSKDDIT